MTKNPTISIQSLGGIPNLEKKTTITGSAHLVKYQAEIRKIQHEIKILLDMGSFGDNKINIVDQLQIDGIGDVKELDAVFISHVHNDHIGNLVQLVKAGYRGPIYMSHTSKAIIHPILKDQLALVSEQLEIIEAKNIKFGKKANQMLSIVDAYNKKGYDKSHHKHARQKQQKEITEEQYLEAKIFLEQYDIKQNSDIIKYYRELPELPFDETDIRQLMTQIRSLDKEIDHQVIKKEGLTLQTKFYPAGHVEGAVQTVLKFGYNPYNKKSQHQLLYTGDLGRLKEPMIIPSPSHVKEKVDQTIIETTYGNRIHQQRAPDQERLIENLNSAEDLFMIPAFSLGRSLEVLKLITDSIDNSSLLLGEGEKIFLDGKLTKDIADRLLERYPEQYAFLNHPVIKYIDSTQERRKIYEQESRKIVIASGGMMQGGSSIPIAHKTMSDKNAQYATVGYQAYGTWGHYLQNKKGLVYTADRFKQMKGKIFHPEYTIERIEQREENEKILISGQNTAELGKILESLYVNRDRIKLKDNEYIYVPEKFWLDDVRGNKKFKRTESLLRQRDEEVYDFVKDKIKVISDEDYDNEDKYISEGPGIHIFWDKIGKKYLNAKLDHYTSFSGHADRDELITLLEGNIQQKHHTTILVHGEEYARKQLEEHIKKNRYIPSKTILPELYDILTFDCKTGERIFSHQKI